MDNAYSVGFDYDCCRSKSTYNEPQLKLVQHPEVPSRKWLWIGALVVVVLFWYALRFIPFFDVKRIEMNIEQHPFAVDSQAIQIARPYIGTSLASAKPKALQHELQQIGIIKKAVVKRTSFSTLDVQLTLIEPQALLIGEQEDFAATSYYLYDEGNLVRITADQVSLFSSQVPAITVLDSYAEHMIKYGVDEGLKEAIHLAHLLGWDEQKRYSIVKEMRYYQSTKEGFGHMELVLPAYHSRLSVRQVVDQQRLQDALQLIKLDYEHSGTRNIALMKQLRYDLYAQSLVKRL